jgi:hypothetical protein
MACYVRWKEKTFGKEITMKKVITAILWIGFAVMALELAHKNVGCTAWIMFGGLGLMSLAFSIIFHKNIQ